MMFGGGFIRHMVISYRNNRTLLKGNSDATYKNFDKSYITDYPVDRNKNVPTFKKASPAYRAFLRKQLHKDKEKTSRNKLLAMLISIITVAALFWIIFKFDF